MKNLTAPEMDAWRKERKLTHPTKKQNLFLFGVIIWLLVVLVGYYYYHKPIQVQDIATPAQAILDIWLAACITTLCGGVGRKFLPVDFLTPLERTVVQFSLGASMLSLLWMVVGALGLYRPITGYLCLLLGWVLFFRYNIAWLKDLLGIQKAWQGAGRIEKFLSGVLGVLIFFQLLIALVPPTHWDTLAYHLQLPRQFLDAGAFRFIPENPYWGHPQLAEMLYTFAMALHRAETATVLCWYSGLLILVGIFAFTNSLHSTFEEEKNLSTSAGWIAVTALLMGATFRNQMSMAYTDLFSVLFGLSALLVFSHWLKERQTRWFIWVGIFCGLAAGAKWTSGVLALGLFVSAFVFHRKTQGTIRALFLTIWIPGSAAFLLAIAPWLIKNFIATGSPVYPYVFSTPWMSAARIASANPTPEQVELWKYLLLPLSITWTGVDGAPGFGTDIGPLLLMLGIPGLWRYRKNWMVQSIAITLLIWVVVFYIGSTRFGHLDQPRLYFSVLPGTVLLAGLGWGWLQTQTPVNVRLRRVVGAILVLVSLLVAWQEISWQTASNPLGVILGSQTRQSYLEKNLGMYTLAIQELERLPQQAKTLLLWEPRGFYAPLNTQADLWIDRWRTDCRDYQSAQAILNHWRESGYTHLMVYQVGVELIKPATGQPASVEWLTYQDLLKLLPEPKRIGETYFLYEIR